MHTLFIAASIAAAALTAPQIAAAQETPSPQKQQSMQSRVKANLEQAGFTDVRIMARSFLVQAKDTEGNPVMMVINPDSVTSVTELSGERQSSGESTTTGAAASADRLSSAQRHALWESLGSQAKGTTPAGFTPKVGEAVPGSIKLQALPTNVSSQIPEAKAYSYALLQSGLLLVDPASKDVVDIITQ